LLAIVRIPFQVKFTQSAFWKGILAFLLDSILHDHLINDLTTENAPPSEKFFADTVEFLENHCPTATAALHIRPPFLEFVSIAAIFVPKLKFTYEINKLTVSRKWGIGRR
jgi:hypothetical protein